MRKLRLFDWSLFLAACAVGPDYSRPDLPTPATFKMAEAEQETESFANLPWWDLLRDELRQALSIPGWWMNFGLLLIR